MNTKIAFLLVYFVFIPLVAWHFNCGGGGGESNNSETSEEKPSDTTASDLNMLETQVDEASKIGSEIIGLMKGLQDIFESGDYLEKSDRSVLVALSNASVNGLEQFQDILNKIKTGDTVSMTLNMFKKDYGISEVVVSKESVALWMKLINQYMNEDARGTSKLSKASSSDTFVNIGNAASLCNAFDMFSKALNDAGYIIGSLCIVATANVAVPGVDEAVACGAFALNESAETGTLIANAACQIYPVHPKGVKIYFDRPCLKQISDIQPSPDQTKAEVVGVFTNKLESEFVLNTILDIAVSKHIDKLGKISATLLKMVKDDVIQKSAELIIKVGSSIGLNLNSHISKIVAEYEIEPKYVKWEITNQIISVSDNTITSNSKRGETSLSAKVIDWPVGLEGEVRSLQVPFYVSGPPQLISFEAPSEVINCSLINEPSTDLGNFVIEDEDMDLFWVATTGMDGTGDSGYGGKQISETVDGNFNLWVNESSSGNRTFRFGMRDLCGNLTVLDNWHTISWPTPPLDKKGLPKCGFVKTTATLDPRVEEGFDNQQSWTFSAEYRVRDDGTIGTTGKTWNQIVKECEVAHDGVPTQECYTWGWKSEEDGKNE